jgi:uncharacterized repeat protein (TIGR01451 family)
MYFEANTGQTDTRVRFIARGAGYALFITNDETVAVLHKHTQEPLAAAPLESAADVLRAKKLTPEKIAALGAPPAVIRMQLSGANKQPSVNGEDLLPGKSNYFIGNDPSKWRTNVATYARVRLTEVYRGIDVVYYGNQQKLEYDFIVRPGADPRQIRLHYSGADRIGIDPSGDLVLHIDGDELRQRLPVVYQESGGRRHQVRAAYRRLSAREFGVDLAAYDVSLPLVIDPVLVYATYLGGSGDEQGQGIAVDASGNAYVTGLTASSDFPTVNPLQASIGGNNDAFVTKLNATGSALVYSTYLGGSNFDVAQGIAVDASGNAYIAGFTNSGNFPTVNPLQASIGGNNDAFVTKLNATGSALLYSTFLGGSGADAGSGIAVDASGNAYITGNTSSSNFPTVNALQPSYGGGSEDAFVSKLTASGSALLYSTYLGGSALDRGAGIAADASENAYVTGPTNSSNFPTVNPLQASIGGSNDAFVTKLNASGSVLLYSTYLGGSSGDVSTGIACDASGNAYITGATASSNFPTVNPAQASHGGGSSDAFVSKLNASGSALLYSTYLGGSGSDFAHGIAIDASGNADITGVTSSSNFPTVNPLQPSKGGLSDAFVSKLNASGSALLYSTYLGGSDDDIGFGIGADTSGNAYITGFTASFDFPTMNPIQASNGGATNGGGGDAFVAKIAATADMTIAKTHTGNFLQGQTGASYTITASNAGDGASFGTVTVTDSLPAGLTATAISGSGWTCTLGTLTCTRSDALGIGSSYPPITLTVNVSSGSAGTVTNTATVAGGGEVNTANDTATDPTTVSPNPAIPALDHRTLAALALLLAGLGIIVSRRM